MQTSPNNTLSNLQKTKSERTKTLICEACVACLVELGYAETTINRVVTRTALSKGALQHHFPSKELLITATADYLLQRTQLSDQDLDAPNVADKLLRSWTHMINTPAYRALLEILIAARTDQRLQELISPTLHQWNRNIDEQMIRIYESIDQDDEDVMTLLLMSRSLMRGLVIQDRYTDDPAEPLKVVKRWIELIAPLLKIRHKQKGA